MPGRASPVQGVTQPTEDHGVAIHSLDVSQSALDAFGPEPTSATGSAAAAGPAVQSRVSLAELKSAGILFDQNDAVAIGQALCRAFIGSQLRRRMNPRISELDASAPMTIDSIVVDATGRVTAKVGDLDDEAAAVQNIGQVLSQIMPEDGRSFLRTKIVSKALASPPQFKTVDELSQSLRAMERPDGREVIRAIFELWQRESGVVAVPELPQEQLPIVPDVPPIPVVPAADVPAEQSESGPLPLSKRRRLLLVAAIVSGGITAFLIGAFVLVNWFSTGSAAPTASAAATVADAPAPPETPTVDHKKKAAAFMGPLLPTRQPGVASSAASVARRAVRGESSGAAVSDAPAPMIATASDVSWRPLDPQENGRGRPSNVPASTAPSASGPAVRGSTSVPDLASTDSEAERIYSAKDPDVLPPSPIMPRLLAGLRPSTPGVRPGVLTVAIVVAPDGTVESVRGLVAPQSMGETVMLTAALSAVKSWRFTPATKDGEPVKYEQVVPLNSLMRAAP